jgi:hypothetical protein
MKDRHFLIHQLRAPRFKVSTRALLNIVRCWIFDIIRYSNLLLAHLSKSWSGKLEAAYRSVLKTAMDLPKDFPNPAVYASAGLLPLFRERIAEGYNLAAKLLSLPSSAHAGRDAIPCVGELYGDIVWKRWTQRASRTGLGTTSQPCSVPKDCLSVTQIWSDGHQGIPLNEEAGKLTKAVLQEESMEELPDHTALAVHAPI